MRLSMFARFSRLGRKLVWGGALGGLLLAGVSTLIGDVSPEAKRARGENASFSLFAGPTAVLTANQIACGLNSIGEVCSNVFDSPTGGGGFWPTGTVNGYIFNTGLQVAGVVGDDGGPWANDTTAAFFFDARGTNKHGTALTPIYDSLNPDDVAEWPDEARVPESELFQPILWDRVAASQQDSWLQYWDGDPALNSGRQHPLGIKVTQRSMAWNYPAGNEAVIYFLYSFDNVTDDPDFQRLNNNQFFGGDAALPVAGYTLNDAYAAFAADMDVTNDFDLNFSTAVLSFDLGLAYNGAFAATEFNYVPEIFFPPFFTNAPGLVGVKYLKSPIRPGSDPPEEVGLTLFSSTLNASFGFPDPNNDKRLWRYLSGKVSPSLGDNPCNVEPEVVTADPATTQRSVCFIYQEGEDTRFFQSSGPFTLAPEDEPATVVVAYVLAATVETLPGGALSGLIAPAADPNINAPGQPSFHPGFASGRGCTEAAVDLNDPSGCTDYKVADDNPVKPIEHGAGWVTYLGPAPGGRLDGALEGPDNKLDQFAVVTVPNSLLGRALVAQSIFDNQFLLGFSPDQPVFYLVPGDSQVTVIWQKSATEDTGDPFYQVANDPESTLYNPNYREFDVEGYRVWRGTDATAPTLLAQFDYDDTTFPDYTCETVPPDEDAGVLRGGIPVVGFVAGETCPGVYPDDPVAERDIATGEMIFNNGGQGGLPGAGVARLVDLSALGVSITQVVVDDEAGPANPILDTGVPFVYVDATVQNNFTYWYAVSAFDVNSEASGPHTLRSAKTAQSTVPRADAPNIQEAELVVAMTGDDGVELDPTMAMPSIDPENGTWSGPMPPTNNITMSFAPLLPRLLPTLQLQVRVDSIQGILDPASDEHSPTTLCPQGGNSFAQCEHVWMSYTDQEGNPQVIMAAPVVPWWSGFGTPESVTTTWVALEIPFDQSALDAFAIPSGSGLATAIATAGEAMNYTANEGSRNRRFPGDYVRHGGSRWFSGDNESVADPTKYINAGHLDGVDTVWAVVGFTPQFAGDDETTDDANSDIMFEKICFERGNGQWGRQADIEFTWGEGGSVTVRDVTHNVDVAFDAEPRATYGFVQDANGNGLIDWQDFNGTPRVLTVINTVLGGGECDGYNGGDAQTNIPTALPLTQTASLQPTTIMGFQYGWADPANGYSTWTATGQGFGLYINSQRYIFQMAALPAAGTVWTLRAYSGVVTSSSATFDGDDPAGYSYSANIDGTAGRPVMIPGLVFNWLVEENTNFNAPADLTKVHTVPDPYLATSQYDLSPTTKQLMFVNLPPQATIRIYTLTGILVDVINHNDSSGGGRAVWNLRNRNNQFVASGVYFFHVVTPDQDEFVGKFTIVNFGGQN